MKFGFLFALFFGLSLACFYLFFFGFPVQALSVVSPPSVSSSVERVADDFLAVEGVTAVMVKELPYSHVVVGVSDVSLVGSLPTSVDGFPVEVVEVPEFSYADGLTPPGVGFLRSTQRPVQSGLQLQCSSTCSLGAVVVDSFGDESVLTAGHCMSVLNQACFQVRPNQVGGTSIIRPSPELDAGLVRVRDSVPVSTATYVGGHLGAFGSPFEGQRVWKIGRTTGYTEGWVDSVDTYFTVDGARQHGFVVRSDEDGFGYFGDSGSMLVSFERPYEGLGLYVAYGSSWHGFNFSEEIQSEFGIDVELRGEVLSECGNSVCETADGEWCRNCSVDCGLCLESCGDGFCEGSETCSSCVDDCACSFYQDCLLGVCVDVEWCGNGVCGTGETFINCRDCESVCGDLICDLVGGEDCGVCSDDCGECLETCGDGSCGDEEDCLNCLEDCGVCEDYCGDGVCGEGESFFACPLDCEEPSDPLPEEGDLLFAVLGVGFLLASFVVMK